jgi:hypothetical protein
MQETALRYVTWRHSEIVLIHSCRGLMRTLCITKYHHTEFYNASTLILPGKHGTDISPLIVSNKHRYKNSQNGD